MKRKLYITLLFSFFSFTATYAQSGDYCLQPESYNIEPVGSCTSTSINGMGADLDNQDDSGNPGGVDITAFNSGCINPSNNWNVYWAEFTGNGNPVTIKALNPNQDGSVIVFENTPCAATMNELVCFNFLDEIGAGAIVNTVNGATYLVAIIRSSGSSSMNLELAIVDNPTNTPYYLPCDPCVNGSPQNLAVHSASIDCFTTYTDLNTSTSGLQADNGNPLPYNGCGSDDDWDWASFTATETSINLFFYGQSSDNIDLFVTEGPCAASMTTILCDNTGDKDYGASFQLNTTIGNEYHVFIRDNGRDTRVCAFTDNADPDKAFCNDGLSFEDGLGAGWQASNGSYHLVSAPGIDMMWDMSPGQVAGRFELTSGGFDPIAGAVLSKVAPGGGNYSFRIGSDADNTDPISGVTFPGSIGENQPSAEMMTYSFVVDPNNAGFGVKYATVMDYANHLEAYQPTFAVTIYNSTGDTISCADYILNPTDGFTQFYSVGDDGDVAGPLSGVIFSPWQDVATDLSGYAGQTVTAEFKVKDCHGNATCSTNDPSCSNYCANCQTGLCEPCLQAGTHFAYAYFDTYCSPMNIDMPEFCAGAAQIDICAPAGYAGYDWPAGQPGAVAPLDQQCLTINNPVAGNVYTVNMITLGGCTVTRTITLQEIPAGVTNDTTICPGETAILSINPTGTNGPYTYLWSPGGATTPSISVTPAATTAYSVLVTNSSGCSTTFNITVTVSACGVDVDLGNDETICAGDCVNLTATPLNTTGTVNYTWTPNIGSGSGPHNVCPTTTTDYIVSIIDGSSQTAKDTITVFVNPIVTSNQMASICQGDSIMLGGSFQTTAGTYNDTLVGGNVNGCDSIIATALTVNPSDDASFNYSLASYCQADPDPTPTITGTAGGTFTSLPTGLNIVASTGVIDLSASTPGTYNILYTTAGVCSDTLTVAVTVTTAEDATYTYPSTNYCQDDVDPIATITGTSGGTFTSTPTGLTIIAATGEVDLSASTPGTYGVLYTTPSASCQDTLTVYITIDSNDIATFNYSLPSYCQADPDPTPSITGTTGGTFTATPAGLSITASTGEVDLSTSTPGTYNVLYTTSGICSDTSSVTIAVTTAEDATFTYSATSYCQNETDPTANITGTPGGAFTATPAGLNIIAGSGLIDLDASTPGTYGVLYTTPSASCQDTLTVYVTIEPADTAAFSYPQASYCQADTDPIATITATIGGTFTAAPTGLSITASTGEVDLSASTPGTYSVLYTTPGVNCPDTITVQIIVEANEDATYTYPSTSYCQNGINPTPTITGTSGGAFTSSPGGLNITSSTGEIDLATSTAGTYSILYTTPSVNCFDTLTVSITISTADVAAFSYPATIFCVNDANQIPAITGTTGGLFSINTGIINTVTGEVNLTNNGVGSFIIKYVTNGACPDSTTVTITVTNQLDATVIQVGPYCLDEASINLVAADAGGTWSGTGITSATTGTFDPNTAGVGSHSVKYSVGTGSCIDSDSITIVVNAIPVISFTTEDDNCYSNEGSATGNVTSGSAPYSYSWNVGGSDSSLTGLSAGDYTLTIIDNQGCTATSTATVNDLANNCDYHIFVPNIFSPNGDGHNDVFIARGKGIQAIELVVYSRWGEKVFETKTPEDGWDGSYKGQEMNAGVFVYYLKATMINNETIEKQGNVTLVR